jgi:hypothetical protein
MRKLFLLALLAFAPASLPAPQTTHTFCASDLACTVTGPFLMKATPVYDIRAYGGACDNTTDNTTAFNNALADAQTAGGGTVVFPLGFLTFDGSFGSAQGSGSGINDMTIGPAVATSGGYLVKLTSKIGCSVGADCDNHRASDTNITNVFLANGNGGTSACGLYIDGSQNVTPGSQGIRITNINNLRVSSTTTADCSVYANNAAHLLMNNIEIDTGFGATPGITITGVGAAPNAAASANVYFSNMELVGDLVIDAASGVQTSGSVFVGGTTSMSANTANSILVGRFTTAPTNSSTTSSWATLNGTNNMMLPGLCVTSTGVCTGANGEIASVTATTTGKLWLGSDATVAVTRYNSNSIAIPGAKLCSSANCSASMSVGDIQADTASTTGAFWLGRDSLSYITRNAGGDVNVKQNLGFRSGTNFIGMLTAPLTAARTYTFPDAAGTLPQMFDCGVTATCSQANKTSMIVVRGGPIAMSGATIAIGSLPFTSATTYVCTANDVTASNAVSVVYGSGTSVTFNGTGTDSIRYLCEGN